MTQYDNPFTVRFHYSENGNDIWPMTSIFLIGNTIYQVEDTGRSWRDLQISEHGSTEPAAEFQEWARKLEATDTAQAIQTPAGLVGEVLAMRADREVERARAAALRVAERDCLQAVDREYRRAKAGLQSVREGSRSSDLETGALRAVEQMTQRREATALAAARRGMLTPAEILTEVGDGWPVSLERLESAARAAHDARIEREYAAE